MGTLLNQYAHIKWDFTPPLPMGLDGELRDRITA